MQQLREYMQHPIIFSIYIIFFGAAILATLALYTRQSLLIAYIVLGGIMGPWGLGMVSDPAFIKEIGEFGIIFLLFLLGLNLEPQSLFKMLRQTLWVTLISSVIFALLGGVVALLFGFNKLEALVIGSIMMYSSTILGLKLLPTTVMHHQRMGEIIISILLLQDIIAIFTLLLLHGAGTEGSLSGMEILWASIALPGLIAAAFLLERWLLHRLFAKFNRIHEYIFLVSIGWCLVIGEVAEYMRLSFEIGAFIAGISLATSPISRFIAESLKPLRDFFLILFFFAVGASLNLDILPSILMPAMVLALISLFIKPGIFKILTKKLVQEKPKAMELGIRIGQISEFSLLVAIVAFDSGLISDRASYLIQSATIISIMLSSYWIVNHYPTPIAVSEKLRRD